MRKIAPQWKIGLVECPMPDSRATFAQIDNTDIFTEANPLCFTVNHQETPPEDVWECLIDNVIEYQENCDEDTREKCFILYSREEAEQYLNKLSGDMEGNMSVIEKISALWDKEENAKYFG